MSDLNLGNSLFKGYNDKHGLIICGYEWGWSKADEAAYVAGEYKLENGLGGAFEKSLVQTNWAATQGNTIDNPDKFTQPEHIDNFLYHIEKLRPKVILFMGSRLADFLNNQNVLPRFEQLVGKQTKPLETVQKEFNGTRFNVKFAIV